MDRELIKYLPLFVQEYKEIQAIMGAEQTEIARLWDDLEQLLNDQFINTAGESAISRWEKALGITPKDTETLEERRFRIVVYLNEQLPYTFRTINEQLTSILGENGYRFVVYNDEYRVSVKLALTNETNIDTVSSYLRRVIPANMLIVVSLYNKHYNLADYTHGALSAYTHAELQTEVLS